MRKILLILTVLNLLLLEQVKAQLPVWPMVTASYNYANKTWHDDDFPDIPDENGVVPNNDLLSSYHRYYDWDANDGAGALVLMNQNGREPGSPFYGATQVGLTSCGDIRFFIMHTGDVANANQLQLFNPEGDKINFINEAGLPVDDMDAISSDREIQVVRVPGTENEYYIIYCKRNEELNRAYGIPDNLLGGVYFLLNVAYSHIWVDALGGTAGYKVDDNNVPIKDRILIGADDEAHEYARGKAVTASSVTVGTQGHDLYLHRRLEIYYQQGDQNKHDPAENKMWIDRFEISANGIEYRASTSVFNSNWTTINEHVGGGGSNGPMEVIETTNSWRLAVSIRSEVSPASQLFLFDFPKNDPSINNVVPRVINFNHHVTDIPGSNVAISNGFNYNAEVKGEISPGYVNRMPHKISDYEFSPNGNLIYFTGGGFVKGSHSYITFLGQIDLTSVDFSTSNPDGRVIDLHVHTQEVPCTQPSTTLGARYRDADDDDPIPDCVGFNHNFYDWHGTGSVQSAPGGRLYFTKSKSPYLYAIPNPNTKWTETVGTPTDIDLSTITSQNILCQPANVSLYSPEAGYVVAPPDQIDGYDYIDESAGYQTILLSLGSSGACTDCKDGRFEIIDVTNASRVYAVYRLSEKCTATVSLCVKEDHIYEIRGYIDRGNDSDINSEPDIVFPNAITNGVVHYPVGTTSFDISRRVYTIKAQKVSDCNCESFSVTLTETDNPDNSYGSFNINGCEPLNVCLPSAGNITMTYTENEIPHSYDILVDGVVSYPTGSTVVNFGDDAPDMLAHPELCDCDLCDTPIPCYDICAYKLLTNRPKYIVSAWVKEVGHSSYQYNYDAAQIEIDFHVKGALTVILKPSGPIMDGWQRIEEVVEIPDPSVYPDWSNHVAVYLSGGNDANIDILYDDIRIFPADGSMVSYVYDPETLRLMAQLDDNNYATYFEYDEEDSLVRTKKETERGVMTIQESRNNSFKHAVKYPGYDEFNYEDPN